MGDSRFQGFQTRFLKFQGLESLGSRPPSPSHGSCRRDPQHREWKPRDQGILRSWNVESLESGILMNKGLRHRRSSPLPETVAQERLQLGDLVDLLDRRLKVVGKAAVG